MPRNGAGNFSLDARYLVSEGDTILPSQHNPVLEDLQTDANTPRPIVAGGTGASTATTARTNLSVYSIADVDDGFTPKVATRTALKALDTATTKAVVLTEASRQKLFMWMTGDFTDSVSGDPSELAYIPADGIDPALGCWVAVTGAGASIVPVIQGGTGANDAATALDNLGGMASATYDPTSVAGDAFDMANMVEATDAKIMTAAERTKLAKATLNDDTDVSGNSWVLDEDDMASDSATKVPTQQSVKAWVSNPIHRDYRHLVKDYGLVIDGATDGRAVIDTAFADIAANGKRRLYLPAGVTRLDYSTLVSLTPPEGLEFFGDGPEDSILEISCGAAAATRTIFTLINSHVRFYGVGARVVDSTDSTVLMLSLGGGAANLSLDYFDVDGGVGFVNPDPDNTLNWGVHVLHRLDSAFSNVEVDHSDWGSISRCYLNDHTLLNDETVRMRFGSGFYFHDFYREGFAINAPSVNSEDWEFSGCRSKHCWDRSGSVHHYGIGSGKRVKILGVDISGYGSGIHAEEAAYGSAILAVTMDLVEAGAVAIRLLDNNIGSGTYVSPKNMEIGGVIAKGTRTADSRGILFANEGSPEGPVYGANVHDNIMIDFERGYSLVNDQRWVNLHHNIANDCLVGYWVDSLARESTKRLPNNNQAVNCDVNYRHDTVSLGVWGGADRGNSAGFHEDFATTLGSRWASLEGSDAAAAVSMGADYVRLTTGATATTDYTVTGVELVDTNAQWRPADGPLRIDWEVRIGVSLLALGVFVGLTDDADTLELPISMGAAGAVTSNASNAVGFGFHTPMDDPDEWTLLGVKDDVDAAAQVTSNAPVLDTYETLGIEITPSGQATFYRNGIQVGTAMTNAVNPNVFLTPVAFAYARAATSRTLDAKHCLMSVGP